MIKPRGGPRGRRRPRAGPTRAQIIYIFSTISAGKTFTIGLTTTIDIEVYQLVVLQSAHAGHFSERSMCAFFSGTMKSMRLYFACLFAPTLLCAAADQTVTIRAVVQQYVDVRDHPDAVALERLFTLDADQLVSSGEWRKGRPAVVKGTIAASQREGGKRTITIEAIRFVTKTVALADGRYEVSDASGNPARKMWTSILLTRERSGWRIAAIRNMLPAPAAR